MSFSASSFLKTSSLWTSSVMMTTAVGCTILQPTNDTKTTTTRQVSTNGKNQYFYANREARRKYRRKPLTTGRWLMTTGCESFVYILLSLIWHRARYHGLGQRKINAVVELNLEIQKIRSKYYYTNAHFIRR